MSSAAMSALSKCEMLSKQARDFMADELHCQLWLGFVSTASSLLYLNRQMLVHLVLLMAWQPFALNYFSTPPKPDAASLS
jgi:hypothetical protein